MHDHGKATVPHVSQRQVLITLATLALLLFFYWHQVVVPASFQNLSKHHNLISGQTHHPTINDDEILDPQRHSTKEDLSMSVLTPQWDHGPLPMFYSISEIEARQYRRHKMARPRGVRKVMGLLFYRRGQSMSILDCYLKRNLVKNGGILDGVLFVVDTEAPKDVGFLDKMLASEPAYTRWDTDAHCDERRTCAYDSIKDDIMYIKIDEGIVYVEDTTIPSIVNAKAAHPEYLSISANIVNQPAMSPVHRSLGAVRPYYVEASTPGRDKTSRPSVPGKEYDWKTSTLPVWHGYDAFIPESERTSHDLQRHRQPGAKGMADHAPTQQPLGGTMHTAAEPGWKELEGQIRQHYSLLENIENGELGQYRFNMWHFRGESPGTQLVALMGRDMKAATAAAEDLERGFSETMSHNSGRHFVVDGHGLASYYSSSAQGAATDVLERYRSFAMQNICQGPMLRLFNEPNGNNHATTQATEERQQHKGEKQQLQTRDIEGDTSDKPSSFLRMELDTN